MIKALRTVGRYMMLMGRTFSRPERMRMFFRQYLNEIEQLGVNSIGIVLLTEKFGREFPDLVNDVKLNHRQPLFVEIPDRHGTGRKPDFITSYVNEAIGLKL